MHKRWLLPDPIVFLFPVIIASAFSGCSISGSVIDRARYETALENIHLDYPSTLCVYYGGTLRNIPLKDILSVEINPKHSTIFNNELFYSADITLKNGTRIRTTEKDLTDRTRLFISVHNSIIARNGNNSYKIGLENVARLNVH